MQLRRKKPHFNGDCIAASVLYIFCAVVLYTQVYSQLTARLPLML